MTEENNVADIIDNTANFFNEKEEVPTRAERDNAAVIDVNDDKALEPENVENSNVPLTTSPKLLQMPNHIKESYIPPEGVVLTFGPLLYRVTYRNIGKLRFSAELVGFRAETGVVDPGVDPGGAPQSQIIQ